MTGAQWITKFRIYVLESVRVAMVIPVAEYVVSHPGFTTPPYLDGDDDDTELDRVSEYVKLVRVSDSDEYWHRQVSPSSSASRRSMKSVKA